MVVLHSIEEAQDYLAHYGVLGMHWGVRKAESKAREDRIPLRLRDPSLTAKTKSGTSLVVQGEATPGMARLLSKVLPESYTKGVNSLYTFHVKDSAGKKVGELHLAKKGDKELNVVWIDTAETERGKGYATAVMKSAIAFAKKEKMSFVTLEVPGHSPDARHVYEKLGFVAGKQITPVHDLWGGLTEMQLDLKKRG